MNAARWFRRVALLALAVLTAYSASQEPRAGAESASVTHAPTAQHKS